MSGYGDWDIALLKDSVSKRFSVSDVYLDEGVLTFEVLEHDIKNKFKMLALELKEKGFVPVAMKKDGKIVIKILRYKSVQIGKSWMPLLLFLVTLGTVLIDGYLRSSAYAELMQVVFGRYNQFDIILSTITFAVALMSIIGIHEIGHLISAKKGGIGATPPYFIPGIPGMMPTFGAVIFQKDPVINRDDLFDSGISGPISGFIISILVAFAAFATADWLTVQQYEAVREAVERTGGIFLPSPIAFSIIRLLFGRYDMVPLFTTLGFAAWLGMVVTAINLFPAWQLDGGRIFRPLLTRRQYKIATYASAIFLILMGYVLLGFLIILMSARMPDIQPLDQVSPLSKGRKLLVPFIILILVLTFVPLFRI